MSAKPWAEPGAPLDERLAAAEVAIANVDTTAGRIAIMREAFRAERVRALEEAIGVLGGSADGGGYLDAPLDMVAEHIRALKADAPAS